METIKTSVVLFLYLLLGCNARVNIILDTDMVKDLFLSIINECIIKQTIPSGF